MKEKYLNELNELLKVVFSVEDADSITNDYRELFNDYVSSGLAEEEVIEKLGDPKEILKSLIEEQKRVFPVIGKKNVVLPKKPGRKVVQAMPMLALIIFLVLGFILEAWHPGWLVFLLIPISGILFTPYKKRKLVALMPFLAVIIFIIIGTYVTNGYAYAWIVFLLIPLAGILS